MAVHVETLGALAFVSECRLSEYRRSDSALFSKQQFVDVPGQLRPSNIWLAKGQRDAFAGKCDELYQKNFARVFINRAAANQLGTLKANRSVATRASA